MNFQAITRGVVCPIVTPLKANGDIKPELIKPLVDWLIKRGMAGIYPLGTTGEGPLFSLEERQTIAAATVDAVAGRVPVIIHTGAISTRDTIALTRQAQACGADAASVITPWYFQHSEAALDAHYRAVLEAAPDFPIYFYNLPKFAGNVLTARLVTRLARDYANAVGLKDSSGDLLTMFAVNQLQDGRFNTAIGPDSLILAGLSLGLDFSVSGSSNYMPEIVKSIHDAFHAGDLAAAQSAQKRLNAVSEVVGAAGWLPVVKGILARRGLPVGGTRAPMLAVSDEAMRACIAQLQALQVDLSRL